MAYRIRNWIEDLQKRGKMVFSYQEVQQRFPDNSKYAVQLALTRLTAKNEIVPVWKGFYAIVPISYALRGIVPPVFYIDSLMKYLQRPYYVALLNAASFYGAAHQQPQEFSVICGFPFLRSTAKKDTKINFIVTRKTIPSDLLKAFKTETGYVQVSSPELTAADLITFQKEIGGLNRACTVLFELTESADFGKLDESFFSYVPVSSVQRLGYLLEILLKQPGSADILFDKAQKFNCKFQKIPLKYSKPTDNCEINNKWKIIINEQIEADE